MLVVYSSSDEILICNSGKSEKELLKDYFGKHFGRDLRDYDRTVVHSVVEIKNRMNVSGNRIIE